MRQEVPPGEREYPDNWANPWRDLSFSHPVDGLYDPSADSAAPVRVLEDPHPISVWCTPRWMVLQSLVGTVRAIIQKCRPAAMQETPARTLEEPQATGGNVIPLHRLPRGPVSATSGQAPPRARAMS